MSERIKGKIVLKENQGVPVWFLMILAIISGLAVANLYYCQPLLELIRKDLDVSVIQVSQLSVLTQIGYAVGIFFVIPMADLYSRRRLLFVCLSILILALLSLGFAQGIFIAVLASFFIGVCSMVPQFFLPIASQFSTPHTKSRNVGFVMSGLLTGILLSRVLSGYAAEIMGWRGIYYIAAVLMLLSLLVIYFILPPTKSNFNGTYPSLMRSIFSLIAKYPAVRICSLRAGFAFGSLLAMWSCLSFHLAREPFNAGSDVVGLLGLCGVVGVLTVSNIGGYVHKFGVRPFNYIGSLLHILSWIIFFFWGYSYIGLILGILLIDIGQQCIQLSNQSYCMGVCSSAANRLNTIFMTTYFVVGSVGTFFAGIGWSYYQWNGVALVGGLFAFASLLVTLFSKFLGLKV